jgi:4-amino-4-deoxy-L-arabinose transferase-like glycosyltransferase
MFGSDMGGQISWLLPAALILLGAGLWVTLRASRTDRTRAALILWGGWLLLTAATFSFAAGIIHPYYTVALAPAIAALVGIGSVMLWERRNHLWVRIVLGATLVATGVWGFILLDRTPSWLPGLRFLVLLGCIGLGMMIAAAPRLRGRVALGVGLAALVTASIGPAAYAVDTIVTPHSGAIPAAGPATAGIFGGPGGGRPGGVGGAPGALGTGGRPAFAGGTAPNSTGGRFPGGASSAGQAPPGAAGFGRATGGANFGPGANRGGGGGGGVGGILSASTPGKALVADLEQDAGSYTWVAATINSNSAAGYQLATDDPVMAIGGFNGTDPAPTLSQFEQYVQAGKIHYFIAGGGGGAGPGGVTGGGTGTTATQITSWVESHFTAKTVSGETIYDLTQPTTSTATSG